jgi:hypothetical protein
LKVMNEMPGRFLTSASTPLIGMILSLLLIGYAWSATCSFQPIKKEIDSITNEKVPSGQEFRKKVHEGWDSVKVLSDLSGADMKKSIDICRFEVAEYLTKLGFPPAH